MGTPGTEKQMMNKKHLHDSLRRYLALLLAVVMLLALTGCGSDAEKTTAGGETQTASQSEPSSEASETTKETAGTKEETPAQTEMPAQTETPTEAASAAEPATEAGEPEKPQSEKNGEIYVLYTSDVHCGVDQGFGFVGLKQVRSSLEAQGYEVILVDDGDAIQGEMLGTLSRGEGMTDLMNAMGYDAAIPGNHEFDYGMDRFLELAEKAEFPYVSCNFNYKDQLVFQPYVILERAGMKIAFVGVTTPKSLVSSMPKSFMDGDGEMVYGFMQDESGEKLYAAVQSAVDAARAEGADLVYLLGHMGNELTDAPFTYADVLAHTNGIDVMFDGHSHDSDQVEMKNKDGEPVVRSACGTKMNCIGYSRISAEKKVEETGIWSWPNEAAAPELLGIQNEMTPVLKTALDDLNTQLNTVVTSIDFDLTINDPGEKDASGNPIRMVRRAETNLGDFCADAFRDAAGADIAVVCGGGVRRNLTKGDLTNGDIIGVHPFGNQVCVIEVKGQQILDALEWGTHALPDEFGGFLQVSGLSYEADLSVPSGCRTDAEGFMSGIERERRVKNVMVGDQPLDPEKTYKLAGVDFTLLANGDGYTSFDGAKVLQESVMLDNQALLEYIEKVMAEDLADIYADPFGEGRITIIE